MTPRAPPVIPHRPRMRMPSPDTGPPAPQGPPVIFQGMMSMPMPGPAPAGSTPFFGPGLSAQHPCSSDDPARAIRCRQASASRRVPRPGSCRWRCPLPRRAWRAAADADGDPPFRQRAGDHRGGDGDSVSVAGRGCGRGAGGAQVQRVRGALGPAVPLAAHGAVPGGAVPDRRPRCTCSRRASSSIIGWAPRSAFGSASASTKVTAISAELAEYTRRDRGTVALCTVSRSFILRFLMGFFLVDFVG
jgi:hypothetical protein